jgi:hypothetical protein
MHTEFGGGGGNLKHSDHLQDQGVDGKYILGWIFKKWNGRFWTGFIGLQIGTSMGAVV